MPSLPSIDSTHDKKERNAAELSYKHILVPTLLYYILVFALYPLQIQIIIQAICDDQNSGDSGNDDDDCDSASISSRAALVNTYCNIALYVPTILLTGTYGALINRYGRKIGLCVPIAGSVLGNMCFLFIHVAQPQCYTLVSVLGCLLMGVSGGYSTFNVSVFSYTSDTSPQSPLERKRSFPIVEGFIFVPKLFAPVVSGLWVKAYGFTYPLVAAAGLGAVSLLWVLCMVPESLPEDAPVRDVPLSINPMQSFENILFIYQHKVKRGRSPLLPICLAFCLYYITYISFINVFILYGKHVFNWGPDTIGFFDGLNGGVHAASMFFAPYVVHWVCGREFMLMSWIQAGYVAWCLFFLGVGVSPSTFFVFIMLAVLFAAGPATPYTRTILSSTVSFSEQAKIFAAFSAVESLSTLFSPLITLLYSYSAQEGMPALVFFVMALLLLGALLILGYVQITPDLKHNLPEEGKGVRSHSVVYSSFSNIVTAVEEEERIFGACSFEHNGSDVNGEKERLII